MHSSDSPTSASKRRLPFLRMTPNTPLNISTPNLVPTPGSLPEKLNLESRPRSWSFQDRNSSNSQNSSVRQNIPTTATHNQTEHVSPPHTPPSPLVWLGPRRSSMASNRTYSPPPLSPANSLTKPTPRANHVSQQRPASIRSSARESMFLPREVASMDSLTSHSEPRLATKFSAGARPVEARGQILSQKQSLPTPLRSRPSSSSANSVTGRQKALGILRPLATLDTPPSVVNKGGSSAPSTTGLDAMAAVGMSITPAVDIISHMAAPQPSDSSDGSQQQQRLGANTRGRNRGNTTTSYDSSDNSISLGRTLQRSTLVAKPSTQQTTAEPVVATKDCSTMDSCSETKSTDDVAPQPDTNTTATATAAAHVSLWSKIASLTLRSTPLSSGSEQSAHPNQSPQKPAVQRLREIEARQPAAEQGATHSNSNPDADADANSTPVPVSASVSDSTSADNGLLAATEPEQDNAVSDAAASTKAADNSVQASAVIQEGDAAVVVEEPIVDTAADNHRDAAAAAIVPETAAVESASAQEQQAAAPAQPAHPAEPARPGWLWGWLRSTPESSKDTAGSPITENRSGNSGDNDAVAAHSLLSKETRGPAASDAVNASEADTENNNAPQPPSSAAAAANTLCSNQGNQSLDAEPESTPTPAAATTTTTSAPTAETTAAAACGHNIRQQTNMLLPDLDVGPKPSAIVPTTATTSTVASIASADCASNHSESNEDRPHTPTDITPSGHSGGNADGSNKDDTDATIAGSPRLKDGQPLYKRLRKVGLSMVDAFVDMAPEWARNLVRERAGADVLGQRGSSDDSSGARMTTQQIRAQMDLGAKSLGRIAVIGVHGWFPIRMLQMIAGEPTGKSEKFCLMMRDALKEYLFEQHGVEVNSNDITLFPLVGEGRIEDRVNILLSQIIDSGESSAHAGQIESGTQSRSESRAAAEANGKQKPGSTAKSSNNKNKQLIPGVSVLEAKDAAGTLPSGSVSSSSGNSTNPAGKQSVMIAESLMPERSRRAQVLAEADTVFVVTHSQGTPVSAMLLERLIELGIVDTDRQRVGMLAMAGISHGPLPYLKDNLVIRYIESEAARELFELMDPSSYQSQRYVAALSTILHKGVRLICVGSWVDEVVPLYSAILQGVSHPNVYRALYIDAPHYADDFLTGLIVFGLRLRNMDIYDHDLLIHLSEVMAGSLWGHSGHSTIYGEPAVYKLAAKWLLYSTMHNVNSAGTNMDMAHDGIFTHGRNCNVSGSHIHMSYRPFNAADKLNPFYIPWIMRTLWDEPEIRKNESLRLELRRLVALFDKWLPETKVGKELKYRLEPVRAAL